MLKKIIALILTVSVLLSMAVVNVHAEEISAERVTKFENAVTLLTKLGAISESDSIAFDTQITRGQFVDILAKIIPVSDGAAEPVFADVPATHKNFNVIQGFADAGYINGHAGNFEPDRAITYHEALYIMLNTMGYGDFMKLVANYAAGGMQIADRLDLDTKNKDAVAGDIFYLVYQALSTDMLAISGMKQGSFVFSADPEKSLLETYHNIDVDTGILQANAQTSINLQYPAQDGKIVVTDVVYDMEEACSILPGCEVDVFFDIDSKEVVCVVATHENTIIEIDSADIEHFRDMKYTYEVNGASKSLKIRAGADIVINNVLATEIDNDAMVPDNGKIVAIDNGTTNGYAVIYVKSYISFVVKAIADDNNTKVIINAENAAGIDPVIANTEEDIPYVFDAEGNAIAIEDISIGTVISVLGNEVDGKIIADEIVTSNAIVTGDLSTIYTDDPTILVIDGVKYPVAKSAEYILATISPQGNMTFLLDFMGNIVALDAAVSGGMAYGYIISVNEKLGVTEEGDECIVVKVLSEIGSIIKYNVSPERVYVDDVRSDKFYDPTELKVKLNANKGKIIRYDVNENREINKIDFPTDIKTATVNTVNNRLLTSIVGKGLYYRKAYKTFSTQVMLDDNTVIFQMPLDTANAEPADYSVIRDASKIADGRYVVDAYKLGNETMTANVVVMKINAANYAETVGFHVVKEVTQILDQYDEVTYSVVLDGASGEKTYTVKSPSVAENPHKSGDLTATYRTIQAGDIVRCLFDETGTIITDITICYQAGEDNPVSVSSIVTSADWNYSNRVIYGNVYATDGKYITITPVSQELATDEVTILDDNVSETYAIDSFKIFKLEVTPSGVDVTEGSAADIKAYRTNSTDYSRVVAHTGGATGKVLFVIE